MRRVRELKERRRIVALSSILICAVLIVAIFWNNAHAELTPVKSISVNSEKSPVHNMVSDRLRYDGSWEFTKTAKWTDYGEAEISFSLFTDKLFRSEDRDVILAIDGGWDWDNNMLTNFRKGAKDVVNDLIDYYGSKVAIVRYADRYENILSDFTNDKDALNTAIDNFVNTNRPRDYQNAFNCIDTLMRNYDSSSGRKVVVVVLSVFYPEWDDVNTINNGIHEIENTYDNVSFRGIQYFERDGYVNGMTMFKTSYNASPSFIRTALYLSVSDIIPFDDIEINDYIDDTYFDIKEIETNAFNYTSDELKIINDNSIKLKLTNKKLPSGNQCGIVYKVKLKDEYLDKAGTFPVGKKDTIYSKIDYKEDENVTTTKTPILTNYKINYDLNKPDGCNLDNHKTSEYASPFKQVNIHRNELSCEGYTFRGWNVIDSEADIEMPNDDYFIMPEHDVTLRAEWSKVTINKKYTGQVSSSHPNNLYDLMKNNAVMDNTRSTYVSNTYNGSVRIDYTKSSSNTNGKGIYMYSPTKNNQYPTYFYRGDVNNNNVVFGNMCWKAILTTPTGGVKLIYNGMVNSDGTCPATSDNYTSMPYSSSSPLRLGAEGYSYGNVNDYIVYRRSELENSNNISEDITSYYNSNRVSGSVSFPIKTNFARLTDWVNGRRTQFNSAGLYHYYGSDFTISNGKYLIWPIEYLELYSDYSRTVGLYTCSLVGRNECTAANNNGIYYIISAENRNNVIAYYFTGGKKYEDYKDNKYIFGSSIESAGDGTYNLVNTTTINFLDWDTNYSLATNKYYCLNGTTNCSDPVYVTYSNEDHFSYIKNSDRILFSNEIEYSDGRYTLKNPVDVTGLSGNNTYKYSCFTKYDTCNAVYYRFTTDNYVLLTGGKMVSDIYPDITQNINNSIIRGPIDNGIYNQLKYSLYSQGIDVSNYLEDTVYCNDRRLSPNSSLLSDRNEGTTFMAQLRNYDDRSRGIDLSCEKRDSFTVSPDIGNGALQVPVGLLTLDEFILAGGAVNGGSDFNYNEKIYLDNGTNYWTMTPMNYNYGVSQMFAVSPSYHSGSSQPANYYSSSFLIGVRPVISIKHNLTLNGGKGTLEEPYTFIYE